MSGWGSGLRQTIMFYAGLDCAMSEVQSSVFRNSVFHTHFIPQFVRIVSPFHQSDRNTTTTATSPQGPTDALDGEQMKTLTLLLLVFIGVTRVTHMDIIAADYYCTLTVVSVYIPVCMLCGACQFTKFNTEMST